MLVMSNYPDLAKPDQPKRKDALVPDPQEYDMSDPEGIEILSRSAKDRCEIFDQLAKGKSVK